MEKFNIVEIFSSIEGEGSLVGYPVTFIRLEGCNLRCEWCDTPYSYDGKTFSRLTSDEIISELKRYPNRKVCLTGGEPLICENVDKLITEIIKEGYSLIIETNGTVLTEKVKNVLREFGESIYIVVSPKPDSFYFINKELIPSVDEFKFIVDETLRIEDIIIYQRYYSEKPLILQPESNRKDMIDKALKLQRELLEKHSIEARVIPQVHKYMGIM
ncbi:7-carboxy-7-deazaguanine synthase QueE [Persephonella sp.]